MCAVHKVSWCVCVRVGLCSCVCFSKTYFNCTIYLCLALHTSIHGKIAAYYPSLPGCPEGRPGDIAAQGPAERRSQHRWPSYPVVTTGVLPTTALILILFHSLQCFFFFYTTASVQKNSVKYISIFLGLMYKFILKHLQINRSILTNVWQSLVANLGSQREICCIM